MNAVDQAAGRQMDVQTPRLRFSCRVYGDPDALPMLLLHGSFATSRWWVPFVHVLPDAILACAPDLRGCGDTDKPRSGYTIEEQAADVDALVAALGWTDFDLVAHSSGGAIAMEFALQRADLLRSLTLVDTAPVEGVFTPLDAIALLEQMREDRELLTNAIKSLMPTFATESGPDAPANRQFVEKLVDDALNMAPPAFTAVAESLGRWNRFAEAKNLTLPTLLIWGELDHIVDREVMTRTLIAIPGAGNLDILPGVGHSPMIEAPVLLAERVIDFITEDFEDFDEIRGLADE